MCPPDRESACDVGVRIRGRRAGTGANPIRPVPISAGPHVNRLERKRGGIGPNVRNRRAENTDRNHQSIVRPIAGTEPDGEEPGRGNDGDRAGTCMVLRKEASLQPFESRTRRRTPAGVRGQIPAGEPLQRPVRRLQHRRRQGHLHQLPGIHARPDRTIPGHRPGIQGERQPPNRNNRWDVVHASRSAGQS